MEIDIKHLISIEELLQKVRNVIDAKVDNFDDEKQCEIYKNLNLLLEEEKNKIMIYLYQIPETENGKLKMAEKVVDLIGYEEVEPLTTPLKKIDGKEDDYEISSEAYYKNLPLLLNQIIVYRDFLFRISALLKTRNVTKSENLLDKIREQGVEISHKFDDVIRVANFDGIEIDETEN